MDEPNTFSSWIELMVTLLQIAIDLVDYLFIEIVTLFIYLY